MNSLISIKELTKTFAEVKALDNISLEIPHGQIIGLLGPNGSGKTTMIKILAGLYKEYEGEVKIDGNSPSELTKAITSYLADKLNYPKNFTVNKILDVYIKYYDDFDEAVFKDMISEMRIAPDEELKGMSKGKIEKVQIAFTMSRKAKLYILDEPLGGVDVKAREMILNLILTRFRPDSTIIVATHLIADIEKLFDSVIIIDKGHLVRYEDCDVLREEYNMSLENILKGVNL